MPDGSLWPKISVIIPNYNYGQFIEETIRSILLQGYPNLECIIIDGASTDNSVEIIKNYEPWLTYWTSEKDKGQSDAINKGMKKSSGEILSWICSDDIFQKDVLQKVAIKFKETPDCHFLTGDGYYFTGINNVLHYIKGAEYKLIDLLDYDLDKYLPQPSVFFSRIAWQDCGPLSLKADYTMDLELWFKIRSRYYLYYLPCTIAGLRFHDFSKVSSKNIHFTKAVRKLMLEKIKLAPAYLWPYYLMRWNSFYSKYLFYTARKGLIIGFFWTGKLFILSLCYSPFEFIRSFKTHFTIRTIKRNVKVCFRNKINLFKIKN